jgi:lysophospholipase L1-like esterase
MNFGLHMLASYGGKIPEYGQWIEKMDDLAKQHDAQLIWVMTTPYEETYRPGPNKTILKFNETAQTVAAKRNIPTVDLHACVLAAVKELGPKKVYTDGTHYTDEAKQRQAAFIAARIREIMKTGSADK